MLAKKVIAVIFAGRRNTMKYVLPYLINDDVIDRVDLCVNTTEPDDLEFIGLVSSSFSKVRMVRVDSAKTDPHDVKMDFLRFYKNLNDNDAVYIKFDDDLLWLSDGFCKTMARHALENADKLFTYPFVINNPTCSYIMHANGKFDSFMNRFDVFPRYIYDNSVFFSDQFAGVAEILHKWFFENYLITGEYYELTAGLRDTYVSNTHFSINAMSWTKSVDLFSVPTPISDDELLISQAMPYIFGKDNVICTDAMAVHYAFGGQKQYLDGTGVLDMYEKYYADKWKDDYSWIRINSIIENIQSK